MPPQLRVGAVSYLNTKPLVWGLRDESPEMRLVFDLPSRLADQLSHGLLDVALIPSVEYFRGENYTILSNACIACRGPVLSVKLFSRVPWGEIQTLALDEGSRTSATLARVLLAKRFEIAPRLSPLPIGYGLTDAITDAVLLIGDRAIGAEAGDYRWEWDLGDVWCRWTELPFVYAMWVARDDAPTSTLDALLSRARDEGLQNLPAIAAAHATEVGLGEEACLAYLKDNLYFHLGSQERRGLDLFYRYACELGLVPTGRELKFHDCSTSR